MIEQIMTNYPDIVDAVEMIVIAAIGINIGGKILKTIVTVGAVVAVGLIACSYFY